MRREKDQKDQTGNIMKSEEECRTEQTKGDRDRQEVRLTRYLREIGKKLEVSETMKKRILSDLENDIRAGIEHGESLEAICRRMGTPEEIAGRFSREMGEEGNRRKGYLVWRIGAALSGAVLVLGLLRTLMLRAFMTGNGEYLGSSVAVIGGADGPTSIYLAGRIADPWDTMLLLAAVMLGCVSFCLTTGRRQHIRASIAAAVLALVSAVAGGMLGTVISGGVRLSPDPFFLILFAAAFLIALGALVWGIQKFRKKK